MITISDGNAQGTQINSAFAVPLQVTVTSEYDEPVQGGVITFNAPGAGATATLSAASEVIGSEGVASVAATANDVIGEYSVTVSASGVITPASFTLSNDYQPTFSALNNPTITFGTSSITVIGSLSANGQVPASDNVSVYLDGAKQTALIEDDGSFSVTFTTALLDAENSPYTLMYDFEPQGLFLGASAMGQLTVSPAPLTITADSTSKTYGQTVTFAGSEFTESGLVNGDTITGVTLSSAGAAATAPVAGSPYAIVPSAAVGTGLGNYTISYLQGSLTVNPAPLTITAESTSKTYGQPVTFTGTEFTESGLVNGDTVTGVTLSSAGAAATARSRGHRMRLCRAPQSARDWGITRSATCKVA